MNIVTLINVKREEEITNSITSKEISMYNNVVTVIICMELHM